MRRMIRFAVVASACVAWSTAAWAQSPIAPAEWNRCTTLNGFVGAAGDTSQVGTAFGGAIAWDITPALAIEGAGSWIEYGHETTGFAGNLKVRARMSGKRTVDPFVLGGIGLYRASFGPDDPAVPDFYRNRMTHTGTATISHTFTDPTLVVGGGLNVFLTRHFAIRPDVEAAIVLHGGDSHVITTAAVHAVYHFESHPVTPARRR